MNEAQLVTLEEVHEQASIALWQKIITFLKSNMSKTHDRKEFMLRHHYPSAFLQQAIKTIMPEAAPKKRSGWQCLACVGDSGVLLFREMVDSDVLPVARRGGVLFSLGSIAEIAWKPSDGSIRVKGRFSTRAAP